MDEHLADFLNGLEERAVEYDTWSDTMDLVISAYLLDQLPPAHYITSVRAVVLTEAGVAILHNSTGSHLLPGGRLESPGESLDAALRREVLEETGCELDRAKLIGFLHFHHQTPEPEGYEYPYPDFLQVVFAARGKIVDPNPVDPTGWEQRVEFVSTAEVADRSFSPAELVFFNAAGAIWGAD